MQHLQAGATLACWLFLYPEHWPGQQGLLFRHYTLDILRAGWLVSPSACSKPYLKRISSVSLRYRHARKMYRYLHLEFPFCRLSKYTAKCANCCTVKPRSWLPWLCMPNSASPWTGNASGVLLPFPRMQLTQSWLWPSCPRAFILTF